MQKNFIRNTIKCNCTPTKIRYNVLFCARPFFGEGKRFARSSKPFGIAVGEDRACEVRVKYVRHAAAPLFRCHRVGHSIEKVLLVGFVKANGL